MVTKAFYTLSIIPFGLYITILCIITFSSSLCCELLEDNDFIFFILVVLNALRHLFQLGWYIGNRDSLKLHQEKESIFGRTCVDRSRSKNDRGNSGDQWLTSYSPLGT